MRKPPSQWTVMVQDSEGKCRPFHGEPVRGSMFKTRDAAMELAAVHPNTTFFIQNEAGRIPFVYHNVKVN